jgi:catecholate siderophore receptor
MSRHLNPTFRTRPLYAALLVALAVPTTVSAQEQESANAGESTEQTLPAIPVYGEGENDYATGVSTVGGAAPTLIRDVPQSVTVINRAVLDSQNATTLTEALRNTPGITLSAGEGGQIGDNVNIRGYSARTDLFLDGVRDRGQYSRETFFLEAVEVLRGPSSMLFGRGSTGGVINQVSKQASLRDHTEIGLSAGTEAYYRGTLDVNRKISDSSAFRVAALGHNNESTRDIIESERSGLAGSLRFGIDTSTEIAVSAVIQRRDDIPDYGVPVGIPGVITTVENPGQPVVTDPDSFYGFTDDEFKQDVDVLSLGLKHEFSPAVNLVNQTQYNAATVHAMPTVVGLLPSTNPDAGTLFTRNRRERDIDDKSLYNQTDLVIRIGEGTVKHTLTLGVEIGRDYYENQTYDWANPNEPNQTIENPVYGPMPSDVVRMATTLNDNESETTAYYVNEQLDLGEHWKIIAGVRSDDFDFSSTVAGNPDPLQNGIFEKKDNMTSHRAGIIYQPDDTQSYYISSGTSFNPSAEALTINQANLNIDPEENRSQEIGAKWDLLEGSLSLTVAVFDVEKTNARSVDPLDATVVRLDGKTAVEGFEIGASGHLTQNWQIFAAYTNLNGKIIRLTESQQGTPLPRDDNILLNAPEHTASLWTIYEFGAWEIGGGAVYSSERPLNNANTAFTEGYTRYDATAAWQYAEKYRLRLNVQNLTDEEYFEVASAGRATPVTGTVAIMTWTAEF